jgi:hypothetical protein
VGKVGTTRNKNKKEKNLSKGESKSKKENTQKKKQEQGGKDPFGDKLFCEKHTMRQGENGKTKKTETEMETDHSKPFIIFRAL